MQLLGTSKTRCNPGRLVTSEGKISKGDQNLVLWAQVVQISLTRRTDSKTKLTDDFTNKDACFEFLFFLKVP